eukprot:TRINITY_DN9376_c0_g1_i1.p1 TRINITY_DN9376_c0_g1~~TRINITY_DN9376_c0_g1_i1.p1  ORF type:complete len:286 (+),score=31.24 TRINITY_DN9376_c0_g1_i1:88-858(+)
MAHVLCAFTSPEHSRSASGQVEFPPGLASVVRPPPGLECGPSVQAPPGLNKQEDSDFEDVLLSVTLRRLGAFRPPPGLRACKDMDAVLKEASGCSDQSTASDSFVSDGSASEHHDSSSSCGDAGSVDGNPEISSRLNADAPAFVPNATSMWPFSPLSEACLLSGTPVKINAGFAVQEAIDATTASKKATCGPAQIVPATSWLAAARAAMPHSMSSCSKARVARPRAQRCEASSPQNQVEQVRTSWAAVVKGRTGST